MVLSGISTLARTPAQASDYLHPLLSFAAAHVPQNKHKETPLYILCTAGMRLLPERYTEQHVIYSWAFLISTKSWEEELWQHTLYRANWNYYRWIHFIFSLTVSVFLSFTGAWNILCFSVCSQQAAILEDLVTDVPLEFDFLFSRSHAEVISGKQEGETICLVLSLTLLPVSTGLSVRSLN